MSGEVGGRSTRSGTKVATRTLNKLSSRSKNVNEKQKELKIIDFDY
jgi:hypothetical protein